MTHDPESLPSSGGTTAGNPFVPENLGAMTPAHRRTYADQLIVVRQKLLDLSRVSSDGASLERVIEDVDAALALLRVERSPEAST